MKITLINGSPRGVESNSQHILNWMKKGIDKEAIIHNINKEIYHAKVINECLKSNIIYIVMPLYYDSMPSQVMKFLEELYKFKDSLKDVKIGFFIHSGFVEARQSFTLREILANIARKFGMSSFETVIYGGSEPTRLKPDMIQRKIKKAIIKLGKAIKNNEDIPKKSINTLMRPVRLRKRDKFILNKGILNAYWNRQLKKNNALDKSFDKPYV